MAKKKSDQKKNTASCSVESYKNKIVTFLSTHNKKLMTVSELESKCRTKRNGRDNFIKAFDELRSEGVIMMKKGMKTGLCSRLGVICGTVTRLSRTFGFASADNGTEYFIPGKYMLGAMPGDKVLIVNIPSRSGEAEGEIIDIISFGSSQLTGTIEGDKVLAEIVFRGKRHAEHTVRITGVFGSSDSAAACAASILINHGAPDEFPQEVLREARKISEGGVQDYAFNNREDLRDMTIFTIDGAESKDLDDAVSISRMENGWLLGVHIADVSYYVKGNSAIDKEAMRRGTSIYYADKVIPMLPKELSNGICSLNPDEDRLTLSAFMELDSHGELLSYRFCKSAVRSRVKGIYSEINTILSAEKLRR